MRFRNPISLACLALVTGCATTGGSGGPAVRTWLRMNPNGAETGCTADGSVCFSDSKTSVFGSQSTLAAAPKHVKVMNFAVWVRTNDWLPDNTHGAGALSTLDLDKETLVSAATDAYQHLKSQFEARGYKVSVLDAARIEASSIFQGSKGDGGRIYNGDGLAITPAKASDAPSYLVVQPRGVNAPYLGSATATKIVPLWTEVTKGDDASWLNYVLVFDFARQEIGGAGQSGGQTVVEAKSTPFLQSYANPTLGGQSTMGYDGFNSLTFADPRFRYPGKGWVADIKKEGTPYGVAFTYTPDKAKLRKALAAVMNAYSDRLIQDWVAVNR